MRVHQLSPEAALASLKSGPAGLSAAEAERRLAEFGPNRVEHLDAESLPRRLLRQFTHFFALVLWLAAALALGAELWRGGEGMGVLAAAIVAVIVINGLFSFWQEYRSEQAIHALRRLLPDLVRAVRGGETVEIVAEALVPGDVILLRGGDVVPADCRLIEALGVQANLAAITGESVPAFRGHAASREHEATNGENILPAGSAVVAGEARAVVFATGMRTALGGIAHQTQAGVPTRSPLQHEVARLSRLVAALATGLGAAFFAVAQWTGLSLWDSTMFAIGIIVANVPEGLLPTVTLALAMGAKRLATKNMLVRHLPAVEALGSVTVICTDKTGTLTENRMVPRRVYVHGVLHDAGAAPADPRMTAAIAHCHSLREVANGGTRRLAGDPLELALLGMVGGVPGPLPRVDELPFDADRKRMSSLHRGPEGLELYVKGALEALLPLCAGISGKPLTRTRRRQIQAVEAAMADDGLRVLAIAWRRVPEPYERAMLERGLDLIGLIGMDDPLRPEVPAAVACCRRAGIRPIMITGDHPATARAVARRTGLVGADAHVYTSDQIQRMSETQLQLALDHDDVVFARTRVDQKRRIVAALQAKNQVVAVTGDGVNDAPALRQADIGIAMGSGSEVAREAADMVLIDDNFATIVAAVEEGRAVFDNIRKFMTYILTSNIPQIVPFLAFVLFEVPLALTVIQILAVDLGTDMVPALALAAEKPQPDVMTRPPRRRDQRLVDWPLVRRAYLFLGPQQALAGMTAFLLLLWSHGWSWGTAPATPVYLQATTACLATIVVMQIANLFACRSETLTMARLPLRGNPMIPWAVGVEIALILAIVYTGAGNLVFGTAPLPAEAWTWPLPFAAMLLATDQATKLHGIRASHRRTT